MSSKTQSGLDSLTSSHNGKNSNNNHILDGNNTYDLQVSDSHMNINNHSCKFQKKMTGVTASGEVNHNKCKKLSFYNEDDDSDGHSSPQYPKQAEGIMSDKSLPKPASDSASSSNANHSSSNHPHKFEVPDTSSTSSCSCEDHNSVAGDLDYDYEDSISPVRNAIHCNEKSVDTPNVPAGIIDTGDESNIGSETKHLSAAYSSNKSPNLDNEAASDSTESTDHKKTVPRIKSVIVYNHTKETVEKQPSTLSNHGESSCEKSEKSYEQLLKYFFKDACYFQIKSINHENVELSKSLGVWSTSVQNELRLNAAFRENRNVILIFSVQQSGGFQGFARMVAESKPASRPIPWVLPERLSNKSLGGVIKVEWLCTKQLPFQEVMHLHNPYNDNKPIKVARDGQQVEPRVGKKLCQGFDQDSKERLLSCLATLKRQKRKSSHRSLYPLSDDRFRSNYGLAPITNGYDGSYLHSHVSLGHNCYEAHDSIYRADRRRTFDIPNHHRPGPHPNHFNLMRPYDYPRGIDGVPRYPHNFQQNHDFTPPFNHQTPAPHNEWHPNLEASRFHPYQRSRR